MSIIGQQSVERSGHKTGIGSFSRTLPECVKHRPHESHTSPRQVVNKSGQEWLVTSHYKRLNYPVMNIPGKIHINTQHPHIWIWHLERLISYWWGYRVAAPCHRTRNCTILRSFTLPFYPVDNVRSGGRRGGQSPWSSSLLGPRIIFFLQNLARCRKNSGKQWHFGGRWNSGVREPKVRVRSLKTRSGQKSWIRTQLETSRTVMLSLSKLQAASSSVRSFYAG